MTLRFIAIIGVLASLAAPLRAEPYSEAISLEVLPGWRLADGSLMTGLHLRLQDGWKTYWRAPGDAGIPPIFDWRRSRNLAVAEVIWPTPRLMSQNGINSVGYKSDVILPVKLSLRDGNRNVRLKAVIDIGICKDICVPRRIRLDVTLPVENTKPVPAIAAALAARPYSRQEAGVTSVNCAISPGKDGYAITATVQMPSAGGREYAVIETKNSEIWVPEATASRVGGKLTIKTELIHVAGDSFMIDRSGIRITVLGSKHAVDIQGCHSS